MDLACCRLNQAGPAARQSPPPVNQSHRNAASAWIRKADFRPIPRSFQVDAQTCDPDSDVAILLTVMPVLNMNHVVRASIAERR